MVWHMWQCGFSQKHRFLSWMSMCMKWVAQGLMRLAVDAFHFSDDCAVGTTLLDSDIESWQGSTLNRHVVDQIQRSKAHQTHLTESRSVSGSEVCLPRGAAPEGHAMTGPCHPNPPQELQQPVTDSRDSLKGKAEPSSSNPAARPL